MYKLSVSFPSEVSNKWRQVCSKRFLLHTKVRKPKLGWKTLTVLSTQLCPLLVLALQRGCPGSLLPIRLHSSSRNKLTSTTGNQYYCLLSPGQENTWLWKMKLFRLSDLQHHTHKVRASFTNILNLVSLHGITVMMDSMTCTSQNMKLNTLSYMQKEHCNLGGQIDFGLFKLLL